MSIRHRQLKRERYHFAIVLLTCHFGPVRPNQEDGWECQCGRCGSDLDFIVCEGCGGDCFTAPGELYEEDPLWNDPEDIAPCFECGGQGSFPRCVSSERWCRLHPLPGRSKIPRHTPEWFQL